jgi:hypothetical protein
MAISYLSSIQVRNHNPCHKIGEIKSAIRVRAHQSIARGIVQVTAIFASGDRREICPNWNIITGREKLKALRVKTNASLIAKVLGSQENIFVNISWV